MMPYLAFGQNTRLPNRIVPCDGVDCRCDHLVELAQNIINAGIFLAIFFAALLFAYAGFLYMTQETIPQQTKAKNLFKNVAIGLVILLSAWLVVDTLMRQLLRDNITWNNICSSLNLR